MLSQLVDPDRPIPGLDMSAIAPFAYTHLDDSMLTICRLAGQRIVAGPLLRADLGQRRSAFPRRKYTRAPAP